MIVRSKLVIYPCDFAFAPETTTQEELYNSCVLPLIKSSFEGFNSIIMAYGQTWPGKTYSLSGNNDFEENKGIIPRVDNTLFELIKKKESIGEKYIVKISFYEIYNETPRELLNNVKPFHLSQVQVEITNA